MSRNLTVLRFTFDALNHQKPIPMKNRFLLLTSALVLASSMLFAGTPEKNISTADNGKASSGSYCGVTGPQICQYMAAQGITLVKMSPIDGTCNVLTMDVNSKYWIVYIDNGIITGYDEANN